MADKDNTSSDIYPKNSPFVDDYNKECGAKAATFNEDGTKVVIDRRHFVMTEYKRQQERADTSAKIAVGVIFGLVVGLLCGRR